eukprot:1432033-Lingulodinium_polyedra.AAC.1
MHACLGLSMRQGGGGPLEGRLLSHWQPDARNGMVGRVVLSAVGVPQVAGWSRCGRCRARRVVLRGT